MKYTALFLCAIIFWAGGGYAQTQPDITQEMRRMRLDLNELQKRVLGGQFTPQQQPPTTSPDGVAVETTLSNLQTKVQAFDAMIRQLNGRFEEFDNKLQLLERKLNGFNVVYDNKLQALDVKLDAKTKGLEEKLTNQLNTMDSKLQNLDENFAILNEKYNELLIAKESKMSSAQPLANGALSNINNKLKSTNTASNLGEIKSPINPKNLKPSKEAFDSAYNLLIDKKVEESIAEFKKFIDNYAEAPELPNAKYWLARAYNTQKKYGEAGEQYMDIYQNYPKYARRYQSLLELGLTLKAAKEVKDACEVLHILTDNHEQEAEKPLIERAKKEITAMECPK